MKDPEGFNAYASGFLANDLDFHGDVVYARDKGEEVNKEVMTFYPDRTYYQFELNRENREGKFTKLGWATPADKIKQEFNSMEITELMSKIKSLSFYMYRTLIGTKDFHEQAVVEILKISNIDSVDPGLRG